MMSTGIVASALSPHHGGQNRQSTDLDFHCDHDHDDRRHPGKHRDLLEPARPDCVGPARLAGSWLNTRWRS
ncbi:conserved hypothetical protein [Mycobacterium marinum M]|uniref:Uncharacterized protein n=2 Tax=Mycobacterium ulcerans group TaxID=2993898 RepID=B2HDY8_MYCMM|nr:conserved hypothetical protein [Mycobacterium ulcerans Agy99]ACC39704.1 conserved hypothetical protein [Mycobacterium marinum M]ULL09811.1 hypothetical protein CKW46_09190 [Mycobacterium liflandii]CDM75362.1 conserved hypothetical protein [Mycobacterium marinum E11]